MKQKGPKQKFVISEADELADEEEPDEKETQKSGVGTKTSGQAEATKRSGQNILRKAKLQLNKYVETTFL